MLKEVSIFTLYHFCQLNMLKEVSIFTFYHSKKCLFSLNITFARDVTVVRIVFRGAPRPMT